ncbi:hypothetical protein N2152v2_010542 [Parachlorella kessleri]
MTDLEKKKKSDKKDKPDKEKKEKKEKAEKGKDKPDKGNKDKKEKDASKPSKDKESKDAKRSSAPGDKLIERKLAADKSGSGRPGSAGAAAAPAKQPKARGAQAAAAGAAAGSKGGAGSYLADYDLPSSESESEDEVERRRGILGSDEEGPVIKETTYKEARKLQDRERKLLEKAAAAKADALRDDDNVFDVAYEQQGAEDGVLSATDIKVHSLSVRAKGKLLLENTTLTIAAGRRYGLVGPNGKGKSTLLRLIARRQIPVPDNLDVLLVEQEASGYAAIGARNICSASVVGADAVVLQLHAILSTTLLVHAVFQVVGTEQSALASVVAADVELMQLREEEAEINRKLHGMDLNGDAPAAAAAEPEDGEPASGEGHPKDDDEDLADRLTHIYDRMQEIGGASAEARASKILHGLGFTEAMQKRATNSFSGGWRMRISLARALYIQPTVLLLDEPTNHLDLRAVLWLEEYLTRWKKTLVVVSHDRDFLNTVTTDIIHLHDERLHYYRGNFAQFEEMYEQRRREVNKEFEKYQKQMKAAKRSGSKANADKVAKDAKAKQQRKAKGAAGYADDEKTADAPRQWNDYVVKFEFPSPPELPPPLMQLIDVSFQYPGREDFGLKDLNIGIDMGSRVAIVGPNGAGKTTLMNLLAGDLLPTEGEQRKSHKLRVGRYAQHFVDTLDMTVSPVEYLLNKFPTAGLKPEGMRAILGRFGLSGHHHLQPIAKLSGGQKARVVFAAISLENAHILLLDEPTNHLDMQSIDALADALEEFEGGVVIISHDSRLLSRVCDDAERSEVWLVEDGTVERYDGDFNDYKGDLIKEIAAELDEDEEESNRPNKP